jgi:DNA-binding GntR family transcriptional regulator
MDFQGLFRNLTYRDQAQEAIRHLIFTGTYKPGQRLKEAEISQKLGISRAPVREAIQTLANDGLIELVPHKGAIVANFDVREVRQLYEVREALEVMAARLAAERASVQQLEKLQKLLETTTTVIEGSESTSYPRDLDFHRGVLELAGNPKLQLVRLWSGSRPGRASESYEEHVAVFEALREKDPEEAERAMRNHISNGLKNMMEILATKDTGAARGLVRSTGGSA